jgi:hypothetical protein
MNKEFIPYEQALALKELGFNNENCFGFYNNAEAIPYIKQDLTDELKLIYTGDFEAPLYQQAFRWFREKYKLHSHISLGISDEQDRSGLEYDEYIYVIEGLNGLDYDNYGESLFYKTPEEAELECLKKLIEIVKKK